MSGRKRAWRGMACSDRMRRHTKRDRWRKLAGTVEARRTCGDKSALRLIGTHRQSRSRGGNGSESMSSCGANSESTLVASLQRSTFKSRRQTVCNAGSVNKRSDKRGTYRPRFSCYRVEACRLLAMNQLASKTVNRTPGNAPSLHWQALLFEAPNNSM